MSLVEVDPMTGALTLVAPIPNQSVTPAWGNRAISALDDVGHRLFYLKVDSANPAMQLLVIDTLSGVVLSAVTWPCIPCFIYFRHPHWDPVTAQLYAFTTGQPAAPGPALVTVDLSTAAVTPVTTSPVLPLSYTFWPLITVSALDSQRREYYIVGKYVPWQNPFRMFTFDLDTGELLGDPVISQAYMAFEVDTSWFPQRGRVTPSPNNRLVPGTTRSLTFEAFGHGGEAYVPFVSCTPGSFGVGGGIVIPYAFDACTSLYVSPFGSAFFALTPPASPLVGALSPGGVAQGTVSLPFSVASGLSLDLNVTFLTLGANLQWTGLHGATILRIQT